MSEPKLTRRQQAEQYLQDPNVRRYLDLLAYAEGVKHGYNTTFGNGRVEDLSRHPNRIWGRTKDGATSATGRYQFLGSTWNEQQKLLGLNDFGAHSQDLAAVSLMMSKGAMDDIMKGDIDTANRKLSPIWASLPYHGSKNQPHRSSAELAKVWQKLQMTGGLGNVDEQQYDPIPTQTAQPTAPNLAEQLANFPTKQTAEPLTAFQAFNATPDTLQPFNPDNTSLRPRQRYAKQLAAAFGVEPETQGALPDYIGDLVKSIYDQTFA